MIGKKERWQRCSLCYTISNRNGETANEREEIEIMNDKKDDKTISDDPWRVFLGSIKSSQNEITAPRYSFSGSAASSINSSSWPVFTQWVDPDKKESTTIRETGQSSIIDDGPLHMPYTSDVESSHDAQ